MMRATGAKIGFHEKTHTKEAQSQSIKDSLKSGLFFTGTFKFYLRLYFKFSIAKHHNEKKRIYNTKENDKRKTQ